MPALLTSSHDSQANGGNNDDDVDASFRDHAANPFLDTPDDKPISAKFRGIEWSDEIGEQDIPLTARVITMRIAKMPWGAIFKIEFTDLKSRAQETRQIRPDYFIVTDERIVLLNEEDNDEAVKKISAMDKAPMFEDARCPRDHDGKLSYEDGPVENDNRDQR